jgi:hypothetical protein
LQKIAESKNEQENGNEEGGPAKDPEQPEGHVRADGAAEVVERVVNRSSVRHIPPVKRQESQHQQQAGSGEDDAKDVVQTV